MAETPVIPIICGPTGSGKTAAALELAARFPYEIINADSRQIIRHLNIGTSKPTPEEQSQAVFHLLDLVEPGESYSAVRFLTDATRVIRETLGRGNQPLVVGGTGLYLRALSDGIVQIESEDFAVRERLEKELDAIGADALWEKLRAIDPLESAKVHPNNAVRIIRALEIYYLTGKTKSELTATGKYQTSGHQFKYFCLEPERDNLYRAIEDRVDRMIRDGLVEEIENLVRRGLGDGVRRANVIGYNEILDHLDGRWTLHEAVSLIKQNSRRYAKRQMTWFRHQANCLTFHEPLGLIVSITKA